MWRRLLPFSVAGAVLVLDRMTKAWIEAHVSVRDVHEVIPGFFNIVHTQNRGAVFGILSNSGGEWRSVFLVGVALVVLALVAGLLWRLPREAPAGQKNSRLALALVLGGALGNVYDRIVKGSVTDFLDFYAGNHHWPSFNVADSAITIGAALLALDLLRSRRHPGHSENVP